MISAGNIYATLTPVALGFILLELTVITISKKQLITFQEFMANFGTALGNQTVNVLVAAGVYIVYGWLWQHFRIIDHIDMHWYTFLLLLLGVDFIFYWVHRWGHHINIMWAAHSPHHSAEEMNYAVALRASVTQRLFSFFFFWPLTIIGFTPQDIYAMTGIHLFIAFLHHTELIPKLWRWVEFVFTTPSHHRVHHGVNVQYLDKNFGEFLIVWDRLFGSFAEEQEKVVYGMYYPPRTWNPIAINFHYYRMLWRDAVAAPFWIDKFRIWLMPLGWRPRGLPERPPFVEITAANQVRFTTTMFAGARPYLVMQLLLGLWLMLQVISANSMWSTPARWIGAALLWHMIINWSGIMEQKKWVFASECSRLLLTALVIPWAMHLAVGHWGWLVWGSFHLCCAGWCYRYFRPES
ncbi:MAG: sterol desaturase family protein [Chitinophagales bacterium]